MLGRGLASSKFHMSQPSERLLIACFCAAWCRTCDDYARVVNSLKQRYAQCADLVWVDIEDQADVLDEVDVENFPTLLISDTKQVYFWGTVLPHASNATQLIDHVLSGDMPTVSELAIKQLNQRLRQTL